MPGVIRRHLPRTIVILIWLMFPLGTGYPAVADNPETGGATGGQQEDAPAPAEDPAFQQEPVEEPPLPTEIPTEPPPPPTATDIPPTETPTPTISPTDVPPTETPTAIATESPTATATSPATVTPTVTVTPTAAASATATPSPTPSPTPTPRIGIRSIVSGSGCTQTSASDVVETTGMVSFSCEARTAGLFVYYSGTVAAPTTGWQYRINNGAWTAAGSSVPTQGTIFSRSVPAFTIDLRPTAAVTAGTTGSVAVSVSCATGCTSAPAGYATVLSATRAVPAPTATDLQLTCTPASVTARPGQASSVTCTYSGRASLGTRQVTLTRLTVPAPTGWTIASATGTVSGTTLTITPNATIAYSATSPQSYAFTFTLTPSCAASTTAQSMQVASAFTFGSTSTITGAAVAVPVARATASSLTMSVQDSTLSWNRTVSFQDSTVDGTLTYRVVASSCTGWSVSVSASPYAYTGPHGGAAIPASNLQLTNAGIPVVIAGSAPGVSRVNTTGSMATSRKVLTASSGAGIGTYEQQLDFSLTIPGGSRAGTYQSTITLTSAAAP